MLFSANDFVVYADYCNDGMLSFRMDIVSGDQNSTCAISWNLGYIAENYAHLHLYSDEYNNEVSMQDNHFDYCVKHNQMYLDINFGYNVSYRSDCVVQAVCKQDISTFSCNLFFLNLFLLIRTFHIIYITVYLMSMSNE